MKNTSCVTRHILHVTKHTEYIRQSWNTVPPFASVHVKLITKDEAYKIILRCRLKLSLLKQTLLDVKK